MRDPGEIARELAMFATARDADVGFQTGMTDVMREAAAALRTSAQRRHDSDVQWDAWMRSCKEAQADVTALIFFIRGLDTVPVEMWENLPAHLREEIENG